MRKIRSVPVGTVPDPQLLVDLRQAAHPLRGMPSDYDPLLEQIGDARFVLLGEASHGTHEFYRERANITRRLIEEKGFQAVAVEADWPDAYDINRFVRGEGDVRKAPKALAGFERFPAWMWRNTDVLHFIEWLRQYNDRQSDELAKAGFYGLDLYSLYRSIEAVIAYLETVDPEAARRAHYRYSCFEHFGEDPQAYGYATSVGMSPTCEEDVVNQLKDMAAMAAEYIARKTAGSEDEYFYAEQNAKVVHNAERYYRSMFHGRDLSWNLRDTHMVETLDALIYFLERRHEKPAKIVIWEHNSHIGDARATEMGEEGQLNVGQLIRERYGDQSFLIGFTTYEGMVTAASGWGEPEQRKRIVPGLPGSYEHLFHEAGLRDFYLPLKGEHLYTQKLSDLRLERAIGVIYHPHTERISHYFYSNLHAQFDAVLHFDQTTAVVPLQPSEHWESGEIPETFPTGL